MDNSTLIGLLGTLIGVYVALHIFNQWTKQKGSEVIANEAKEIFNLIEKIPLKMNIVLEDMMKMSIHNKVPNDFDQERFMNFKTINVEIIKRLQLIKFKNRHRTTLKIITNFNDSYRKFAKHYHQQDAINLDELLNSKEEYKKCFTNLKNDMYEYALFKKTI